jgi:hypothetical protein
MADPEVKEDGLTKLMKHFGIPVTRENYIDLMYMGTPPDPWTWEDEAEMPPHLQKPWPPK